MASKDSSSSGGDFIKNMLTEEGAKRKVKARQSRSSQDLDEENIRLRNENFNLKLRLHFKEHANEDMALRGDINEALAKELAEAKMLIQALRDELADKTQLLKDAAVAISEHEDRENEFVLESQAKIAVLEGCLAHLQHEEAASSVGSYMDLQIPVDQSDFKEEMRNREKDLVKIKTLQRQLSEKDTQMEDYDQKLKDLSAENSDLINLLQQHYKFTKMANQLMRTQKKELHACLVEKLAFIKRMNEILPELNCQKEMLKEATLAVQGLMETADLKDQFSRELLANYRAAIIEAQVEARKEGGGLLKWAGNSALQCSGTICDRSARSASSSYINSDVSLPQVTGAEPDRSSNGPIADANVDAAEQVNVAASSPVKPSKGKTVRTHSKSSFSGLLQLLKCWGRQSSK